MCDVGEKEECSICLEQIIDYDTKLITVCNHTFHANCLRRWTDATNSCPLCRTPFSSANNVAQCIYPHLTEEERQEIVTTSRDDALNVANGEPYIPLQFWFTRDEHLLIPEVAYNISMRTAT